MDLIPWVNALKAEWMVISQAPWSFLTFGVLVFALAYFAARWQYSTLLAHAKSNVEQLQARLQWKTEQAEDLKERALKHDVKVAGIVESDTSELREKALKAVEGLREFIRRHNHDDRNLLSQMHNQNRDPSLSEEVRIQLWQEKVNESIRISSDFMAEYDRRFKVDLMLFRDELQSRLPDLKAREDFDPYMYEHPTNPLGVAAVADDLEFMAKSLKPRS